MKFAGEKKELQPKMFEPIDILPACDEKRKRYQSMGKIVYETEKIVKLPEKSTVKVVLNRNF